MQMSLLECRNTPDSNGLNPLTEHCYMSSMSAFSRDACFLVEYVRNLLISFPNIEMLPLIGSSLNFRSLILSRGALK